MKQRVSTIVESYIQILFIVLVLGFVFMTTFVELLRW